ncbi:MAG: ribonuclease HI [Synergistaceae bacterium]|nr:ribonuclease HI [Synergistaceae bacterium]
MNPHVIIYTDGGASPNPGIGGWAAILYSQKHEAKREISGGELNTTNNRMEITAAIKALEALKTPCDVDLYTDSAYLCNTFEKKWIVKWQKNKWKSSTGEVLNRDLWEILLKLTKIHNVSWHHVKGHADDELNNRCDELVQRAREELR